MTTLEQILLKLGIDQSQVAPGLADFKSKVNDAVGHGEKSFLKLSEAGRSFRGLLGQLTQESPALGYAFRLALDPVVGTMAVATAAFAYFNSLIQEGTARVNLFGAAAGMSFGDAAAAAGEAAKEVAALRAASAELNAKEGQARADRNEGDEFSRGLKDEESRTRRAQARLEQDRAGALGVIAAAEKSGALGKDDAAGRRAAVESQADAARRRIERQSIENELEAHRRAGIAGMAQGMVAEGQLQSAEAAAADPKRHAQLGLATRDVASFKAQLEQVTKAMDAAKQYQADTAHVAYNRSTWGSLLGWDQSSAAFANLTGWFKEQATGITGDQMLEHLQAMAAQYRRAIAHGEGHIESLTGQQKTADAQAAAARDRANKIEAGVREHGIAAQDAQRRLDELGPDYPSLTSLAKGGNRQARTLLELERRHSTEDPASTIARLDAQRIDALKDDLHKAGLQPDRRDEMNPLLHVMDADGTLRVKVQNVD